MPYREQEAMKTKKDIELLAAAALRAAKVEFSAHPSMTSTHEKMAEWIRVYLAQHGVAANVAYIVNVGGDPKFVGVFKVYPYPSVRDVEFEVMVS